MKKISNYLIIYHFIACLSYLALVVFHPVIFPSPLEAAETMTISGLTEPVKDVTLSLEVAGRIAKIFFKEGDQVALGSTLLELNKKYEELEIERRKMVWESKAELNSAQERVKTLKSILDSTKALFESMGSVSKEEIENKELEYKLALAEYERLQNAEDRERVEYEMAAENLDKMILKSPIQGIVTKIFFDEGENCEQHEPLIQVVDTSKCLLVCTLEASLGKNLKKGQTLDLKIPAGPTTLSKKGKVIFVSPVVDSASGLFTIKVEFDNHDASIRPGIAGSLIMPAR